MDTMRTYLRANIGQALEGYRGKVALALSGGTDSLCLLFTLLDLDIRPRLYTYYVHGWPSADSQMSQRVAEYHQLEHVPVPIFRGERLLLADVRQLLHLGVRGKVRIQCCHGHLRIAQMMRGERLIINGSGVDGLYGTYKTFAFNGSCKDRQVFNRRRSRHLADANDDAMQDQVRIYQQVARARVIYPYRQDNVVQFLLSKTWDQINRPKFKNITLEDFPEIKRARLYRPRGSQQIVAGTRELHDKLLKTYLNKPGFRRVDELYKHLARRVDRGKKGA